MAAKTEDNLTQQAYWDCHWANLILPTEHRIESSHGLARAILEAFESQMRNRPPQTVLEIGGAPGGYLAHFARRYGSEVHALDYSAVGCSKTEENFRRLGLPVAVHQLDLLEAVGKLPRYDLVYSLGLIEHFADPIPVVRAHVNLAKPGGMLVLGVPHFVRVFWPLLVWLAPRVTTGHNRRILNPAQWRSFEAETGLTGGRTCYLGGFDPCSIASVIAEEHALGGGRCRSLGRLIVKSAWVFRRVESRAARISPLLCPWQRLDSRHWSSFAMGFYDVRG